MEEIRTVCYLCGGNRWTEHSVIKNKPVRETDFNIQPENYLRRILVCQSCNVFLNIHSYDLKNLYKGGYNQATYGDQILNNYLKIRSYPEDRSINKKRVKRIAEFLANKQMLPKETKILDVGSGLCVFLGEFKDLGFRCYCIDPDPLSVKHALDHVKVDGAFCGVLADYPTDEKFGLIAFNKVLEHVKDPVFVLADAKKVLARDGFIYMELPDATNALKNGNIEDREEFFIEHYMIFTEPSLHFLSAKAGYQVVEMKAIHEPGDKYTLYAFLRMK